MSDYELFEKLVTLDVLIACKSTSFQLLDDPLTIGKSAHNAD